MHLPCIHMPITPCSRQPGNMPELPGFGFLPPSLPSPIEISPYYTSGFSLKRYILNSPSSYFLKNISFITFIFSDERQSHEEDYR